MHVRRPRCPFCHEDLASGARQLACNGCRAWHHAECWVEGGARCASCHAAETGLSRRSRLVLTGEQAPVGLGWWGAFVAVFAVLELRLLPAFRAMFEETGIPLPRLTEFVVLEQPGWLFLVAALLLLHLGALGKLRHAGVPHACALTLGFACVVGYALFAPLACTLERL